MTGMRLIHSVDLHEVSVVTFPNGPSAGVSDVYAADVIDSVRGFERHLRDAGFSKAKAQLMASRCKDVFTRRDAVETLDDRSEEIFSDLKNRFAGLMDRVKA
jgi:hypothetical protein